LYIDPLLHDEWNSRFIGAKHILYKTQNLLPVTL
jgi:hypothetical protein